MIHRYSFTSSGDDSVGVLHSTLGGGASISGGKVVLDAANSQYVQLPASILGTSDHVTLEMWITIANPSSSVRIYHIGADANAYDNSILLSRSSDVFAADINGASSSNQNALSSTVTASSIHLAVVYEKRYIVEGGTNVKIFADGVLVGSNNLTLSMPSSAAGGFIGNSFAGGGMYLSASIDEFRVWNTALSASYIALNTLYGPDNIQGAPTYSPTTLQQASLIHRYSFITDASDSVGTAHGTRVGAGIQETDLSLVRANSEYMQLPENVLGTSDDLTIEMWLTTFNNNAEYGRIYQFGTNLADNAYSIMLARAGNVFVAYVQDTGIAAFPTSTLFNPQTDIHIAVVHKKISTGTRVKVYMNGVLAADGNTTIAMPSSSAGGYIGKSFSSADPYFDGTIDELRIWSTALSGAYIAQNYLNGPNNIQGNPSYTPTAMPSVSYAPSASAFDVTLSSYLTETYVELPGVTTASLDAITLVSAELAGLGIDNTGATHSAVGFCIYNDATSIARLYSAYVHLDGLTKVAFIRVRIVDNKVKVYSNDMHGQMGGTLDCTAINTNVGTSNFAGIGLAFTAQSSGYGVASLTFRYGSTWAPTVVPSLAPSVTPTLSQFDLSISTFLTTSNTILSGMTTSTLDIITLASVQMGGAYVDLSGPVPAGNCIYTGATTTDRPYIIYALSGGYTKMVFMRLLIVSNSVYAKVESAGYVTSDMTSSCTAVLAAWNSAIGSALAVSTNDGGYGVASVVFHYGPTWAPTLSPSALPTVVPSIAPSATPTVTPTVSFVPTLGSYDFTLSGYLTGTPVELPGITTTTLQIVTLVSANLGGGLIFANGTTVPALGNCLYTDATTTVRLYSIYIHKDGKTKIVFIRMYISGDKAYAHTYAVAAYLDGLVGCTEINDAITSSIFYRIDVAFSGTTPGYGITDILFHYGTTWEPTLSPSIAPSVSPSVTPTQAPSVTPSMAPTASPTTTPLSCPAYTLSNTYSAQVNYATCSFTACGGATIIASDCDCSGNQYLRLYSPTDEFLAFNDDSSLCGSTCSSITYTVPGASNACGTYTLREGCSGTSTCTGSVTIQGAIGAVSTPTSAPVPSLNGVTKTVGWSLGYALQARGGLSVVMSSDGVHVVAVHDKYLYYSSNYGVSFTLSSGAWAEIEWDSLAASATGQVAVAGSATYPDIYVSLNYGQSWTVNSGFHAPAGGTISAAVSADGTKIAVYGVGSNVDIWYVKDYTANTESTTNTLPATTNGAGYMHRTKADTLIFFFGTSVWKSENWGTSWTSYTSLPALAWKQIEFDVTGVHGIAMYTNGVYISSDSGATWTTSSLSDAITYTKFASDFLTGRYVTIIAFTDSVFSSSDFGATFTANVPSVAANWRAISCDDTCTRVIMSTQNSVDTASIYLGTRYFLTTAPSMSPSVAPTLVPTASVFDVTMSSYLPVTTPVQVTNNLLYMFEFALYLVLLSDSRHHNQLTRNCFGSKRDYRWSLCEHPFCSGVSLHVRNMDSHLTFLHRVRSRRWIQQVREIHAVDFIESCLRRRVGREVRWR